MENFDLTKYFKVKESAQFSDEMDMQNIKCYKAIDEDIYFAEWNFKHNCPIESPEIFLCVYIKSRNLQSIILKDFIRKNGCKAYELIKTQLERAVKQS